MEKYEVEIIHNDQNPRGLKEEINDTIEKRRLLYWEFVAPIIKCNNKLILTFKKSVIGEHKL